MRESKEARLIDDEDEDETVEDDDVTSKDCTGATADGRAGGWTGPKS
jgi:hypothetical protein